LFHSCERCDYTSWLFISILILVLILILADIAS
jgi:hypothetical protein